MKMSSDSRLQKELGSFHLWVEGQEVHLGADICNTLSHRLQEVAEDPCLMPAPHLVL